MQLPIKKFWAYSSEANILAAEQQLRAFEASAYPHLEKKSKKQLWDACLQLLNKQENKEPKSEKQRQVENRRWFKRLKARGLHRR